jgi:hypothetical protein
MLEMLVCISPFTFRTGRKALSRPDPVLEFALAMGPFVASPFRVSHNSRSEARIAKRDSVADTFLRFAQLPDRARPPPPLPVHSPQLVENHAGSKKFLHFPLDRQRGFW